MAAEKPSFWTTLPGVLTGMAGLITACVALYSALHTNHPPGNSAPPQMVQVAAPPSSSPSRPTSNEAVTTAEAEADVEGTWQGSGTLQNGAPYSAEIHLSAAAMRDPSGGKDINFFIAKFRGAGVGPFGFASWTGAWSIDPASRTLVMRGGSIGGSSISFECRLTAEDRRARSYQGNCSVASLDSVRLRLIR